MGQPDSEKWHKVQNGKPNAESQSSWPLKCRDGKEIFRQASHYSHSAYHPADGNQIAAKNIALCVPCIFHNLPQLHIVEHFHAQRLIGPNLLVYPAAHQIKSAHAHVVLVFGSATFQGRCANMNNV